MTSSAIFSHCGRFRLRLDRELCDGLHAAVCMANPSKAGADQNDPTIATLNRLLPARGTRTLSKADMLHNAAVPDIRVDPQTFDVFVDGALATCEPAERLPLTQLYMLR